MAQNITLLGASYSAVPAVNLPKTGGGTAKFTDVTGTTAVAADVAQGKIFFDAQGNQQTGTGSGGGGGSAISVVDTLDSHGGTIRTITAVDLSSDTVSADKLLSGYTAHNSSGNQITGTFSGYNTSDATAVPGDVAQGKVFYNSSGRQTGTASGGASKNAQTVQQTGTRIASTTMSKACGDITVAKSGTYDVYWTAYRTSTSGTWGTQLYIGGSAYGSKQSTFTSSYYQAIHLSNVSLTANQTISVYGQSRGSNYYLYVGQLTIIEA